MRRVRRLFTFALALVMTFAVSAIALAAANYSITINNGKAGETYTAYKMFDLSVDNPDNPQAYRYTVNSDWAAFAQTAEFKDVYKVDDQGYVTSTVSSEEKWSATSDLSKLAEKAAAYAKNNNIAAAGSVTISEGETSGVISLTGAGYYVVTSTLGSRAMIDTTPANPAVKMNEKNEEDTIEKTVKEDSTGAYGDNNDAQVGDTVEFKSIVNVVPRSINVVVHDTMDSGLTLNANSIKIYTNESLQTEYTRATVKTGDQADEGDTFTIVIPDPFAANATSTQKLYIVYTAEVNKNAIVTRADGTAIVDQNNKTKVTFGDGTSSVEDTTTTTTHKFAVLKYKTGDNNKANLAGAVFQLKKDGTVVNLIKVNDTNYRVADDTETGTAKSHANNGGLNTIANDNLVSDFVTVSSDKIVIWGVDSDSDYTLDEVQPPEGYNKLFAETKVTVNADNSSVSEIANATGTELPSTGGIGTTIFYVVGGVMVAGAVVFLLTKRRVNAE